MDGAGNWRYHMAFDAAENAAVLTAGHLRVVYVGEAYNGSSSGSVGLVAGSMGSSQSGSLRVEQNGTSATVKFRGHVFSLLAAGKTVKVGDESHALDDATNTTIRFAQDGTAKVTEEKVAPAMAK